MRPWNAQRYDVRPQGIEASRAHQSRSQALDRLTVAPELEGLPLAVGSVLATTNGVVVAVALANSTALVAGSGEATRLTVLVHRLGDPVNAGIAADGLVLRVNANDFEVLVDTILVHPVRVEDTEVRHLAADTLLSKSTERALGLQVVHTLTNRLTVSSTLRNVLLAVTAANTHTVDDVALLSLVAETASLVRARGSRGTVHHIQLTVLPAAIC